MMTCAVVAAATTTIALAGSINDIEHIVIFMQENRAFDHYYGSMRGVRGELASAGWN